MEWPLVLAIFLGVFIGLLLLGIPVAFAFLITNLLTLYLFAGGAKSLFVVIPSAFDMLISFTMLAVPLFILMGEVIFHSGVGEIVIDALDVWIGRLPGRLSLLAVAAGTIFAMLSGSSVATTAMLGSVLVPQMRRRGYSKGMCLGPILGGGSLAVIIPPTFLAVVLATLAEISIAGLLLALVMPGLLLGAIYIAFIIVQAVVQPNQAPPYRVAGISFVTRLKSLRHILPLGIIIFLVIGVIFLGIAAPEEAAALGALGTFVLAASYRRLNGTVIKKILTETASITCMVFMIVIGSTAFSQLLAYTGASRGLLEASTRLPLPPIFLVVMMQIAVLILGTFMDQISIMMITIPMLVPIVSAMGFDLIWFCTMTMLNLSIAGITPPFGLWLFALKGVVPEDVTFEDIVRAGMPYIFMGLVGILLVLAFPPFALWLPGLAR